MVIVCCNRLLLAHSANFIKLTFVAVKTFLVRQFCAPSSTLVYCAWAQLPPPSNPHLTTPLVPSVELDFVFFDVVNKVLYCTCVCWNDIAQQTEAEFARQNPGKMISSANCIPIPPLPVNPSRIDRLIVESFREHANVSWSFLIASHQCNSLASAPVGPGLSLHLCHFPGLVAGRLPWQPAGIKFTQCVSCQKSAFSPLQEKLCVGSKNDCHLLELSRRSLSACKVWGDRTTRAGCRSENWCFLYVTFGLPARGGHCSNKYCVTVYGLILMRFSALFLPNT